MIHWTWSSGEVDVHDLWVGTDAGGAVNEALAPAHRADACAPGPEMLDHDLLSYRRPAVASNQEAGYGAKYAVDLSMESWWSAASGAPQWLEIDLEAVRAVGSVRIPIGHVTPQGQAEVAVYVRETTVGPETLGHTFTGGVTAGDVLERVFEPPLADVRYIRFVLDVRKDSGGTDGWVILHEVEVRPP